MDTPASGSSHAKIILIGEHSVVYHQPAIALPLPAVRESVTLAYRNDGVQQLISRYYTGARHSGPKQLGGINELIDELLARFDATDLGFDLTINSHLPAERGMGSSAATAVAIIRALYQFLEQPLSHDQLLLDANISEKIIHGNPSGIDAATASAKNPIWFITGTAPVVIPFHMHGYLVVADSGIHGQTGLAVKAVAHFRETDPQLANQAIKGLGQLTYAAKTALANDRLADLGTIFDQAQARLQQLGVSHPQLDEMISVAKQNGALGAKLTGGGMGGCMICLAPDESTVTQIRLALANHGAAQSWVQPLKSEDTK
ncbi:mevalonate kinase [Secundilactobacillus pentosiphilus]|uniref:Mevalonate kinase n=1 Tax=Secundilactobacillus pentosiphilus TaxID=1714682 RepID=A0A1Z5ILZ6_9LACO|nr:mevalonate kinase [Secundilactobacillus pentosiphilus]GAX02787.1 mevalonate kinase [Secundilactobacillus pentosiphilus]